MDLFVAKNKIYTVQIMSTFIDILIFPPTSTKQNKMYYIVEWTTSDQKWVYFNLKMGQHTFIKRNCTFLNCFLVTDPLYFNNVTNYDVFLFNAVHLNERATDITMPPFRENNLYVFAGFEPAAYYPTVDFDGIFNNTWSYKLSSDVVRPYFIVKNKHGEVIGPRKNMHWTKISITEPLNDAIRSKLLYKSIAAAIISSHCEVKSKREEYVKKLQDELDKYGHRVDIFGKCGNFECRKKEGDRKGIISECSSVIERDYYFYLAFENSFGEDYVTEKVLHALNNFAVPVVYGGANYSRFMPDGIYLNARWLGPRKLAIEMDRIINNSQRYFDFFKWHGLYSFHDVFVDEENDGMCDLCALVHNVIRGGKEKKTVKLTKFWNTESSLPRYED